MRVMDNHRPLPPPPAKPRPGLMVATLVRIMPVAVLVLISIWFFIRHLTLDTLDREIQTRLTTRSHLMADAVGHRLNALKAYALGLSTNDLIADSLMNPAIGKGDLPRLFHALGLPEMKKADIHLTDSRGRTLISTQAPSVHFANTPFFKAAMENKSLFHIDPNRLTISYPVRSGGLAEGMLGLTLEAGQFAPLFNLESRFLEYAVFQATGADPDTPPSELPKGQVVFSTSQTFTQSLSRPRNKSWHRDVRPIPGYPALWLVCGIQAAHAISPYEHMEDFLATALILDIMALGAGIYTATRLAARPLKRFIRILDRAKGSPLHTTRLPEQGPRELIHMAQSFNSLIRELEQVRHQGLNKAVESGRVQFSAMLLHTIGNAVTPLRLHIDQLQGRDLSEIHLFLEQCYREIYTHRRELDAYMATPRGQEVFAYMGELIHSFKNLEKEQTQSLGAIGDTLTYITDILSIQQTYAPAPGDHPADADLNEILETAIKLHGPSLEKRGISLVRDLTPDLPPVDLDKSRLLQVGVNLLKNAGNALETPEARHFPLRQIRITSFYHPPDMGFEIQDTGAGFTPEQGKNFFKAWESGNPGMGLYYCKLYLDSINGHIHMESPGPGKGARVRVTLPCEGEVS